MSENDWKLINHDLQEYPSGIRAGDRVRVRRDIVIRDASGQPTGDVHRAGEIWTVDIGVAAEPDIVWFRHPDGERHTWDYDQSFQETFEVLPRQEA